MTATDVSSHCWYDLCLLVRPSSKVVGEFTRVRKVGGAINFKGGQCASK